jgi:hypothetical protein
MIDKLKIGMYPEGENGYIAIYLVNGTDLDFEYQVLTGAFASDEEGVLESAKVVKEKKTIKAHSANVFDRFMYWWFDFSNWYHLDFFSTDGSVALKLWADLPKYAIWYGEGADKKYEEIPYTNKRGVLVPLESRDNTETIQREVVGMDMSSKYHKS